MKKFKVFFIGLNNETLLLLNKSESLKVVGVNYFDYFNDFTLNPIDQIFRLAYNFHYKKKFRNFSLFLLKTWECLYVFSSKIFRNNKDYLNCILVNNIEIINTEEVDHLSSFIKKSQIDLLVINSWGVIENSILNLPKYKTINIHPSILPQYRGALPTLWSLKNKDKKSAITYIVLNEFIDDGVIIGQHFFDITESDDWYSLEQKIEQIFKETFIKDVLNYLNNNYSLVKTTARTSFTGYYEKYRKIELLEETSEDIYNKVGLYPYLEPFLYCFLSILDRRIYIKRISYFLENFKQEKSEKIILKFGFVLFFTKNGILKSWLFKDINFRDSIFIIFNKIFNKI